MNRMEGARRKVPPMLNHQVETAVTTDAAL